MPDLPTGTITFLFSDIEGSTRLWGAAMALGETLEAPLSPQEQEHQQQAQDRLQEVLGEGAYGRAWDEGHAMTMEEAIDMALENAGC